MDGQGGRLEPGEYASDASFLDVVEINPQWSDRDAVARQHGMADGLQVVRSEVAGHLHPEFPFRPCEAPVAVRREQVVDDAPVRAEPLRRARLPVCAQIGRRGEADL